MSELKIGWLVLGETPYPPYVGQWGLMKEGEDLKREYKEIKGEIENLKKRGFSVAGGDIVTDHKEVLDLAKKYRDADVLVVYGVSGAGRESLKALMSYGAAIILFTRVRKDEMYGHALYQQWYQRDALKRFTEVDLVINDYESLVGKLRAHRATKTLEESKILCIGEPNDFFKGGLAARTAVKKFRSAVDYLSFERFSEMLEAVNLDDKETVEVKNEFLENAEHVSEKIEEEKALKSARVYTVLRKLIDEEGYDAVTANCLSGILNLVQTTPCLAFQRLRDEGIPAVCEADFPQLVTTILLRNIADRPTFINDPVILPNDDKLIVAHCTAPTKMAGFNQEAEKYDALLHHETELGVAPSVKMKEGQKVTIAGVSHDFDEMIATTGDITRNTDYHICITQAEVEVEDGRFLFDNFMGFHWVLVYGDWMEELKKACDLLGMKLRFPGEPKKRAD